MSIPVKSAGTGNVYLGNKIVAESGCDNYNFSDGVILEGRLGRNSTSSRHGGLYIYPEDFTSVIWFGHTSYYGGFEFMSDGSSSYARNSFTGFLEFRLKYTRSGIAEVRVYNTLDSGSPIWNTTRNLTYMKDYTGGLRLGIQSNDRYYHDGQFDRFRICDFDGQEVYYQDFNDNQLPSDMTLYGDNNWSTPVNNGYSLSNGILTLATDPYNRCLLHNDTFN